MLFHMEWREDLSSSSFQVSLFTIFFTKVRGKFEIQSKRPKIMSDHVTSIWTIWTIWTYQFCTTQMCWGCINLNHCMPRSAWRLWNAPSSPGAGNGTKLQWSMVGPWAAAFPRLNELASPDGWKKLLKYPKCTYPLVIYIAIENCHLEWVFSLKMVIFHSYVSLPEGTKYGL